ncbi:maltokinase N-terminal cap-like domain-containing protein [Streptomyces radicis]|uniref:Maltokinase n=1 Tax=Streptomyces radicis TaxID=1750517 RepID=A0A3A9W7W8_9ACTN|nr:phosphotransferase [Streptomyces radicis]RKN09321.1 maltokinase [Streptomyces radicis]RKN23081.1 maltokinase [Streptomyces radicis]
MSDSSSPRTAQARLPLAGAPHGGALLRSLTGLLARWLPRQRWFAGKGRPLSGLTLIAATELLPCTAGGGAPGLLHLLIRTRQSPAPGSHAPPVGDCYQLLLGVRDALPPSLGPALVGRPSEGPLRGASVYEALHDPRLAAVLLERLRTPGRLGTLSFRRAPGAHIPEGLPARLMTSEQSNSSVVYGESHILKLFRRVSPGVNPDLELPLALAAAGCPRVPGPSAWFEAAWPGTVSEPLTLGVLAPFLPGSVDGWQLAIQYLGRRADFTSAAHSLGRATAEVHTTLAEALPTSVMGRAQLEQAATGMSERLAEAAAAVPALRPYRAGLRRAFEALADFARRGGTCPVQRLHGDLHLGQVLLTPDARGRGMHWSIIDFEGEPARPLAERRRPGPVARDIAGMLRSFDYAAAQARAAGSWVDGWSRASRAAYCRGYAEAAGSDPLERPELLRAHETDKAVYEVLYEARHRPAWLHVPMAAIRRLAAAPD